mgnify:CR=1 FL=1
MVYITYKGDIELKKILIGLFLLFTIGGLAFVSFPMIKNAKENLVEESARHQAKKSGVVESTDGLKTKSEPLTIVDDTPYKDNEAGS